MATQVSDHELERSGIDTVPQTWQQVQRGVTAHRLKSLSGCHRKRVRHHRILLPVDQVVAKAWRRLARRDCKSSRQRDDAGCEIRRDALRAR